MLISEITYNAHPILGDLHLDLMNHTTGMPYNTILLAGENGTGKTTVLETLNRFLNQFSIEYFKEIKYIVNGSIFSATPSLDPKSIRSGFYIINKPDGTTTKISSGRYNSNSSYDLDIELQNPESLRSYGSVLSKARADFNTSIIRNATTSNVDTDLKQSDNKDDYTALKQLFVDIETKDNETYREINRGNSNPVSEVDFEPISKMFRFKNAFNTFFDSIKFDRVKTQAQGIDIIFKKGSSEVSIDQLSTGEKQIVYRGAYLLRNQGKMAGGTAFIDEPELSMHPKWARKILTYFRNIFTDNAGVQTSQLFLATHSEHVISEALRDKDNCLVIVLRNDGGVISAKRIDAPSKLPTITSAETNYLAFDIYSNDYHIELYGALQRHIHSIDSTYNGSIKKTDDYILSQAPTYNPSNHAKSTISPNGTVYQTVSTAVRNSIDHPDTAGTFTEAELISSTELLRSLLP